MPKAPPSLVLLIMVAAVVGGLTLWRLGSLPRSGPHSPVATAPAPAPSEPPPEPAIKYPLETRSSLPPLRAARVGNALVELLGRKQVSAFVRYRDFPVRFMLTVDNLARPQAPPALWPIKPTPGRFIVQELDEGPLIAAGNAARYVPFVVFAESVNTRRAVDLYVRMYPFLQAAYEDAGFSSRYFNDRLVGVIDLLLATPEVDSPLRLHVVEVKGSLAAPRPRTQYEFADSALESLPAGQKVMLRVGRENQRRLKAKLTEIRAEIVKRTPAK